jgi:hypothetical protein
MVRTKVVLPSAFDSEHTSYVLYVKNHYIMILKSGMVSCILDREKINKFFFTRHLT